MGKTYLIIDVSNLAYRSAYGCKSLNTSKGRFSGHVFGSVSSIIYALSPNEPSNQDSPLFLLWRELRSLDVTPVFCYDGKDSKVFRRTILPEYKANRQGHDFNPLPEVQEILRLWPGIHVMADDKEGDDGIAYAVKMRQGKPCVVWSGDKDLQGLLQFPNVKVFSPNLKRFVESSDIYDAYHLMDNPGRIYLAKALFGDASDGIKGVERLTKKQVEPFLNALDVNTPDDFYRAMGALKPQCVSSKNWEKLQADKDKVQKNYQVVLPQLDFQKESVTKVVGGFESLKAQLVEYECFSLLPQIDML
jgi:5'-3' exonuclease